MGVGKSFGLGLIVYLLLNLGMSVVTLAVTAPETIGAIFSSIDAILLNMLSPILAWFGAFTSFATTPFSLAVLFEALGLILPGLIGALVAGKSSDSAGAAFGGWVLAGIIASVLWIVLGFVLPGLAVSDILLVILSGLSVGFFWGGIAAVSAGP